MCRLMVSDDDTNAELVSTVNTKVRRRRLAPAEGQHFQGKEVRRLDLFVEEDLPRKALSRLPR